MTVVSDKIKKSNTSEQSFSRKFMYDILYPFGLISTAVILLMALLAELTKVDAEYKPALTLRNVVIILVFCFFFALANRIFYSKTMAFGAKVALHGLALTADFIVTGIFFSGYYRAGTSAVAIIAIFVAVYLMVALVAAIIRYAVKRAKAENSHYKRQF